MRVAVLGAGAIGAYVGAMLARAGVDVSLIARGPHCTAMREHGVRVLTADESFTVHPPVSDDPGDIGEVDLVFLGLKAHQYAGSGNLLKPLWGPKTVAVAAQNGIPWWYFHGVGGPHEGRRIDSVDPGGAVSRILPPSRAIGCVVYCSTELVEPGVVRHLEGIRFPLGDPAGASSGKTQRFSQLMRGAGLKAPVVFNIRDHIWVKLMGNAVFNPLSALTGATLEDLCRDPATRAVVTTMMGEVVAVANAFDIAPSVSVERRIAGAEAVGAHKTSMLQDLEAKKTLELDALLTAVVELADTEGVAVPTMRTVHALVSLLASQRALARSAPS